MDKLKDDLGKQIWNDVYVVDVIYEYFRVSYMKRL